MPLCKYCHQALSPTDTIGQITVCPHCFSSYSQPIASKRKLWIGLTVVLLAGLGVYTSLFFTIDQKFAKINDPDEMVEQTRLCKSDLFCLRAAYKRRLELSPQDWKIKANYAMTLTRLNQHREAKALYQELLSQGTGTYDVMAFYGQTLKALGENQQAAVWFENALQIHSGLVDVVQQLGEVLFQSQRRLEAISLLESFIARYPEARGYLQGNLVTMKSQLKPEFSQTLKLLALSDSHHFLPLQLGDTSQMFLVDTGASVVTFNTETFNRAFPDLIGQGRSEIFKMADGRAIEARSLPVPFLQVGGWKIANVEVAYCDHCQNLAGRSLLQHFSLRLTPKGGLSVLEIEKN